MFSKNAKPQISPLSMPAIPTAIIFEDPSGGFSVLAKNGFVYFVNSSGVITNSKEVLDAEEILSFKTFKNDVWVSTNKNNIYSLNSNFQVQSQFKVDAPVTSIAHLEDGSGLILFYFKNCEGWFEHRSLPDLKTISTSKLKHALPVISSGTFVYRRKLHVVCCSKKGLYLYTQTKKGLWLALTHTSAGGEINFSQVLLRANRFLVDNMTSLIKTDLRPYAYMNKACFFRNFEAESGAIDQNENWIAFLNPASLKLIDYNGKKSYKFETPETTPAFVKILNHKILCGYGDKLYTYEFRQNSIRFIMEE